MHSFVQRRCDRDVLTIMERGRVVKANRAVCEHRIGENGSGTALDGNRAGAAVNGPRHEVADR